MLKRTITLVGLTITLGALLLALGCGGSNNTAPVATGDSTVNGQSRFWMGKSQTANVTFHSSPPTARVKDDLGLWTITVQTPDAYGVQFTLVAGRDFPYGSTVVEVVLPKFGEAPYHSISVVNLKRQVSIWAITPPDGKVTRKW